MDGLELLRSIPDEAAALVILDPQYRALLDKMKYGNEGAQREARRASLPAMTDAQIMSFLEQSCRVLRPSGHVALWLDKFALASGHYLTWLVDIPDFAVVDLIAWNKMRIGMGRRTRCRTEYVVILQKKPTKAVGVWTDHSLPDTWSEKPDRSVHPHAKPARLTGRLIRAVTKEGDLVVDPCAGSYVTLRACEATGREFMGCDIA